MVKKKTTGGRKAVRDRLAKATTITLEEWLGRITTMHQVQANAAVVLVQMGACLVKDPQTGRDYCMRTTPDTCKALKGYFVGGPCGGG